MDPQEDENTVKVKRRREPELRLRSVKINSLEALEGYFTPSEAEKRPKIKIFGLKSAEILAILKKTTLFPAILSHFELFFTREAAVKPDEFNEILNILIVNKPGLEGLKLTFFGLDVPLEIVDWGAIGVMKGLKRLAINVGMNDPNEQAQEAVLKAFLGHQELEDVALMASNCGLGDAFLRKMNEVWFEAGVQGKWKKVKLNLSNNSFQFAFPLSIRQLFLSFQSLEILKLDLSFTPSINKVLMEIGVELASTLVKMLTLRVLKLNLLFCGLEHASVEFLCEGLVKLNERLEIELDLREPIEREIPIKTIKSIEGMVSLFRGVTNPRKYKVFY